jgi:hypothetical protein
MHAFTTFGNQAHTISVTGVANWHRRSAQTPRSPCSASLEPPVKTTLRPHLAGFSLLRAGAGRMTDLTNEEINSQIDTAYTGLRDAVERMGAEGISTLALGVALVGLAVEITINVAGRKDAERLIKEIVSDRFVTYVELAETAN